MFPPQRRMSFLKTSPCRDNLHVKLCTESCDGSAGVSVAAVAQVDNLAISLYNF